jgi:hypothetical protein
VLLFLLIFRHASIFAENFEAEAVLARRRRAAPRRQLILCKINISCMIPFFDSCILGLAADSRGKRSEQSWDDEFPQRDAACPLWVSVASKRCQRRTQ